MFARPRGFKRIEDACRLNAVECTYTTMWNGLRLLAVARWLFAPTTCAMRSACRTWKARPLPCIRYGVRQTRESYPVEKPLLHYGIAESAAFGRRNLR